MLAAILAQPAVAANERSIADLGWLVGDWTFEDVALPAAGFRYREVGTRRCDWALRNQYIRCVSEGGTSARPRTYVTYFNYNADLARFEMTSMWSNTGGKDLRVGSFLPDGRTLRLQSLHPDSEDGPPTYYWSTIVRDGEDSYVWEGGNRAVGATADGPARFRDVVKRRP